MSEALEAACDRLEAENARLRAEIEKLSSTRYAVSDPNLKMSEIRSLRAAALEEAAKTVRAMAHASCVHESCNGLRAAVEAIRGLKDKP